MKTFFLWYFAFVFVIFTVAAEVNICTLPPDVGPCDGVCQAYYFNTESGLCQQFEFGCCPGNANNFKTKEECVNTCRKMICSLPAKTGPCKANRKRYFFNKDTRKCQRFTYGGCQANANNFETIAECKRFCQRTVSHTH